MLHLIFTIIFFVCFQVPFFLLLEIYNAIHLSLDIAIIVVNAVIAIGFYLTHDSQINRGKNEKES